MTAIAPITGAAVPANPVLHIFVPKHTEHVTPQITVRSTTGTKSPLPTTITEVSRTESFASYRVVVNTGAASAISVKYANFGKPATYTIDRTWTPPTNRRVKILSSKYKKDYWSCSHTDAQVLSLSYAPTYKVEWAINKAALERGETKTIVFPSRSADFWRFGNVKDGPQLGDVWLGHLSCFGATAPNALKLEPGAVRVVGLYPDGVVPAMTVKPATPPKPRRKMTCGYAMSRYAESRATTSSGRQWPWLATLATGLLGFFFARRRLRYATASLRAKVDVLRRASLPQMLFVVYAGCSALLALRLTNLGARDVCAASALAAVVSVAAFVAGVAFAVARSRR